MSFFFNDTATTEIYTLSLHDALPISTCPTWEAFLERVLPDPSVRAFVQRAIGYSLTGAITEQCLLDRKSTRLNSSHANISYAVFCLKKKKRYLTTSTLHYSTSSTTLL